MNNSLTNFSSDPNSPNYGGKHKAPRSYITIHCCWSGFWSGNNDSHLSENYLLDNLNNVNSGGNEMNSDFDTSLDTTSTTHFVVIDKNGKLASTTNTLSSFFGSGKFVKQGFYMNNSLTNFSSDPNSPNYGGKHKAPRSYITIHCCWSGFLYGYWYTRWKQNSYHLK